MQSMHGMGPQVLVQALESLLGLRRLRVHAVGTCRPVMCEVLQGGARCAGLQQQGGMCVPSKARHPGQIVLQREATQGRACEEAMRTSETVVP